MSNPNSKPVLILACCILGAFFMPWFQLFGFATSGFNLGRLGSYGNYAWIVPILAGATIILSLSGGPNREVGAMTGIVPLGAIVYGFIDLGSKGGVDAVNAVPEIASHVLCVGAYVTILCSVGIIIAAAVPATVTQVAPTHVPRQSAPARRDCPDCDGKGKRNYGGGQWLRCQACNGTGEAQ